MATKVTRTRTRTTLYLLLLCKMCGIGIFMKGFFPLKRNSPGFSSINANGIKVRGSFDRLIVIMIDALRADFVFHNESYMPFTKYLIEQGNTFSFMAHSNPPTVTMPRIKAITTGTIPGFIDVILNVDSKELLEDNIITQMKMCNLTINFFGDDTWVKLFPDHFKRSDGTTSFFVTDYIEVDNNVTRHLKDEMERNDWDVTVLHYLGLDHIGHLSGPASPLVQPKLAEMDNIVQMIYTTAVKQDQQRNISTLIILCGDHGMSDGGSHGGSSIPETTTPLVFMSSLFQNGQGRRSYGLKVNQIDIAPTLSLLMGLSIPKNSIGILLADLFSSHSGEQRLEALRMNALQIFKVFEANAEESVAIELNQAIKFHNEWLTAFNNRTYSPTTLESMAIKISQIYILAMEVMTNQLTKTMSSYDNYALYIGIWMLVQSLLGTLCVSLNIISNNLPRSTTGLLVFFLVSSFTSCNHLYLCSTKSLGSSELFCTLSCLSILLSVVFVLSTAFTLTVFIFALINFSASSALNDILLHFRRPPTEIFLILGIFLHNVSLFSTSFIEEEHQTWYFLTTSYHISLCCFYFRSALCNQLKCTTNNQKTLYYSSCKDHTKGKSSLQDTGSDISNLTNHENNQSFEWGPLKRMFFVCFILLCCDRILRSWNQTGIKWADQTDIGDCLVKPENKPILSFLLISTLVTIIAKIYLETRRKLVIFVVFCAGVVGVYVYRAVTGAVNLLPWRNQTLLQKGIPFAQWVHLCVLFILLLSVAEFLKVSFQVKKEKVEKKDDRLAGKLFIIGYLLLILLLVRPHNIPLVAVTLGQTYIHHQYIWKRCKSILEIVLSAYYLGWFTYFSQGNSNSLATVDIAAGYIGFQQNYSPIFVAILTSLATFSGPLFWMINALVFITKQKNTSLGSKSTVGEFCVILLLIKTINVTVCAIMSWLNCYHLFVWSVFSPKILYEGVISVVFATFIVIISIIY